MYLTPAEGFPLKFCNGPGAQKHCKDATTRWSKKSDNVFPRLDTILAFHGKMDRIGQRILCCAWCNACWCAIKMSVSAHRWYNFTIWSTQYHTSTLLHTYSNCHVNNYTYREVQKSKPLWNPHIFPYSFINCAPILTIFGTLLLTEMRNEIIQH